MPRSYGHYVTKRGGWWYVRVVVPEQLRHLVGLTEIRRSLKTSDRKLGSLRALEQAIALHQEWQQMAIAALVKMAPDGTIEVENPTPEESALFLEAVRQRAGTTPATATTLPFSDAVTSYMSERAVTPKSHGEALSILQQYDTWCSTEKRNPWLRTTAVAYRAGLQKRLHAKTANKHTSRLSSLGAWAARLDHMGKNPFDGLRLPLPKRKASEERPTLTLAEVGKLLAVINPTADAREWWVLLALYSGARPNEIAQLYVSDIVTTDGIPCLSINDSQSGQRLKNIQSKRLIPVHQELIHRGFLDWIERLKRSHTLRLFSWSMSNRNGAWRGGGEWYKRLRDRIGLEKDAHSIRHTVITCLRNLRQPPDLLAELAGHMREGITLTRYSKDSPVAALKHVVDAIPVNPGCS